MRCSSGDIRNTPNDEYENFVNAHMEAVVTECMSTKLRDKQRAPWETLAVKNMRQRENSIRK